MAKIKICYIIGTLNQGGAERQIVELIKNINKIEFEVTVFIYSQTNIFYSELYQAKDINLIMRDWSSSTKIFRIIEARKVIRYFLQQNNFDIVHTTLHYNGIVVRIFSPKRYYNRIISTLRNNLILFTKIQLFLEVHLIKRSWVIANSIKAADDFKVLLKKRYRYKVLSIYNGYDLKNFSASKDISLLKSKTVKLIMVGRLTEQKNQIQVLRVLKRLNCSDVLLHIFGEPHDAAIQLENFISKNNLHNNIKLMGAVKNIYQVYADYNIFIMSSYFEGCPNALFEALLSKRFCIISEQSNTDNFIKSGINGLVYDGTDDDLYVVLKSAIEILNTKKYYDIIQSGYNYAIDNFSLTQMVYKHECFYKKIIELNN